MKKYKMDKANRVYDSLPDKRSPWICFEWVTNNCKVRNYIYNQEKVCHQCRLHLYGIINDPILQNMTLHKFLTLSFEDRLKFIIKHEVRKNRLVGKYKPETTNKFAKSRSLSGLKREDLSTWEIYYTFKKYTDYLKKKYIQNRWLFEAQIKQDPLLFSVESEKQVSEYIEYNTTNRSDSEKWFNFEIVKTRPENSTFKELLNYGKVSDICLIDNEWLNLPINTFSLLTIKNKNYKKLSEQIKYYINNPNVFEKDLDISFSKNRANLIAYLYIVEQIEWICKSNKKQSKDYVTSIFKWRKSKWEAKKEKILGISGEQQKNCIFEIAEQKSTERSVEKIIISHDGNILKATDNCRWTIIFKTIEDLQRWAVLFMDTLKDYNQTQKDPYKKVTEVYFEDKFWNLAGSWQKASGYRDGKFLIKLWDGNVIELMLHLEDIHIAKNEWFDYIWKKSMLDIINDLELSEKELNEINKIIDQLDPTMTNRWKSFLKQKEPCIYQIPHLNKFKHGDRIPADLIYNIYRNLQEYDRVLDKEWRQQLPLSQEIKNWPIIKKLQLLEKEIYERWYKKTLNKIHNKFKKDLEEKEKQNFKEKIFKKPC